MRAMLLKTVSCAGAVCLLTLTAGCTAVGPDFQRPEAATAETWLQADDERVDTTRAEYEDWWKVFEDPALDQLIDRAYNDNLSLQVAGLRILEARAQLGFATGLKYPQSQSVGASFVRSKSSENAPPFSNLPDDVVDRIDTSVNFWSTSFDIAWEADVWGRFRRGVEAADANLAANMLNYDAVLVSLTGDVAMTYATIRTLQQRLAYVRQNVVLQEQGLELAETRFEFGATSELDVQQSRGLLESTRSLIPFLQVQIRRARNVLSLLLGMPPSELKDILGGQAIYRTHRQPRQWESRRI